MKVFIAGGFLIILALLVHVIVWRIRLPKNQMGALLKVFLSVFLIWLGLALSGLISAIGFYISIYQHIYIGIFYFSMVLAYTLAYSTIEADSPSLTINRIINEAGVEGVRQKDLMSKLNLDRFLEKRMEALVDKMVSLRNGRYMITSKGRLAMRTVMCYRRLLNIKDEIG